MRSLKTKREFFASKPGFVLAAAGSAVGLGNMWRFSYQASEGGGAAFVCLYLLMTILIGLPIMVSELLIGRTTRRSPIDAYQSLGGRVWSVMGLIAVLTPIVILSYFSVITGWVIRYGLDAFSGFSANPGQHFAAVSEGWSAAGFHFIAMGVTVAIVIFGVRRGIERASIILMPLLLTLLIAFAVWTATLDGAMEGYRFYLSPSLAELANPTVIRQAAAQAFLSLSVGMGVMITYGSYIDKEHDLIAEGAVITMLDFSVAFIGGLVVFPLIFALGLSATVGESTVGALFISLPAAFQELGAVGQVTGFLFFAALLLAGLTSAISLLEVAVSSLVDRFRMKRVTAVSIAASAATVFGLIPALDQEMLGLMDKIASEFLVVAGALASLVLARRVLSDSGDALRQGEGRSSSHITPVALVLIRYVAPAVVGIILVLALADLFL